MVLLHTGFHIDVDVHMYQVPHQVLPIGRSVSILLVLQIKSNIKAFVLSVLVRTHNGLWLVSSTERLPPHPTYTPRSR
jgi:hypothetical protein